MALASCALAPLVLYSFRLVACGGLHRADTSAAVVENVNASFCNLQLQHVVSLLKCCPSLKILDLSHNPGLFSDSDRASSLGEGLKCNSSVQRLDLVSCGVDVCIERC